MSNDGTETAGGTAGASVWTDGRRTKSAGLVGMVVGVVLALLATTRTGLGIDPGSIGIVYPVGYLLASLALFVGNAWYGDAYGNRGGGIGLLFALSVALYGVAIVGIVACRALSLPIGLFTTLVAVAFFGTRILGTAYGFVLWRRSVVSGVTAGLFIVVFPSVFVLGPLALFGFPAFGVELPLYLAFVAFGYELWRDGSETTTGE